MTAVYELSAILGALTLALGCAKIANSANSDWKTITAGNLSFSAPPDVARTGEQGIDSASAAWESDSLRISIDSGPFSDGLRSYGNKAGYKAREESINGRAARIVEFDQPDGKRFTAARFDAPPLLTFVVVANEDVDPEVPQEILRGIRFDAPAR